MLLLDVCRVHRALVQNREAKEDQNWHRGSPRHTRLGHHSQGQKVKGQGHQAALLTAALTCQAAAAMSVGTYWPWEPTATLNRCSWLGGARCFCAHRGRRGAGAYYGGHPPAYSLLEMKTRTFLKRAKI